MTLLLALTPFWLLFEFAQLFVSERYLGLKQIKAGQDLRGQAPAEWLACVWVVSLCLYWLWMAAMLFFHIGFPQVLGLVLITCAGYSARRICGLRLVLVILTFEGALRIGMLGSLTWIIWRGGIGV